MLASIDIENVLAEWPQWQLELTEPPRIVQQFKGGLTNLSYLIQSGNSFFKLRVNNTHSQKLGIDRKREASILSSVVHLNIAPRLLYSAKSYHYSVFEFVEGSVWSEKEFSNNTRLSKVQDLIEQYQCIKLDEHKRNYLEYLESYRKQLNADDLTRHEWCNFTALLNKLEAINGVWPNSTLCHHDIVPGNIVESCDKLYILDWEYAATGCGELDFLSVNPEHSGSALASELHYWLNKLWFVIQRRA